VELELHQKWLVGAESQPRKKAQLKTLEEANNGAA
jgi:hypothetical protein